MKLSIWHNLSLLNNSVRTWKYRLNSCDKCWSSCWLEQNPEKLRKSHASSVRLLKIGTQYFADTKHVISMARPRTVSRTETIWLCEFATQILKYLTGTFSKCVFMQSSVHVAPCLESIKSFVVWCAGGAQSIVRRRVKRAVYQVSCLPSCATRTSQSSVAVEDNLWNLDIISMRCDTNKQTHMQYSNSLTWFWCSRLHRQIRNTQNQSGIIKHDAFASSGLGLIWLGQLPRAARCSGKPSESFGNAIGRPRTSSENSRKACRSSPKPSDRARGLPRATGIGRLPRFPGPPPPSDDRQVDRLTLDKQPEDHQDGRPDCCLDSRFGDRLDCRPDKCVECQIDDSLLDWHLDEFLGHAQDDRPGGCPQDRTKESTSKMHR